jgi:hypothetical protein
MSKFLLLFTLLFCQIVKAQEAPPAAPAIPRAPAVEPSPSPGPSGEIQLKASEIVVDQDGKPLVSPQMSLVHMDRDQLDLLRRDLSVVSRATANRIINKDDSGPWATVGDYFELQEDSTDLVVLPENVTKGIREGDVERCSIIIDPATKAKADEAQNKKQGNSLKILSTDKHAKEISKAVTERYLRLVKLAGPGQISWGINEAANTASILYPLEDSSGLMTALLCRYQFGVEDGVYRTKAKTKEELDAFIQSRLQNLPQRELEKALHIRKVIYYKFDPEHKEPKDPVEERSTLTINKSTNGTVRRNKHAI